MKKINILREELSRFHRMDSHVHTHLCDGKAEMTVEQIAKRAQEIGVDAVILTPHFHKRLERGEETLYEDSDEAIFPALREEITFYESNGGSVRFFLASEVDIVSFGGTMSLPNSHQAEMALDFVMPTFHFHPLLPLKMVGLTYGKEVNGLHESGEYARAASAVGGVDGVLDTMYQVQIHAINSCPYPAMLGHFFMPHSVHPDRYNCFGAEKQHLELMKEGALGVIDACKRRDVMMDLTGVHLQKGETVLDRIRRNGFLVELQQFVIREAMQREVPIFFGSDAHSLNGLGSALDYYAAIQN